MPLNAPGPMSPPMRFPGQAKVSTFTLSGITKDVNGAAVGGCTVNIFETATNLFRATVVSDAFGNYSVGVTGGLAFYAVVYKAGSPDVFGTTLNTLAGV